jgi:outer membrane protein OmpA-like peptidoglycan-associated protein/tetratricopeptide (TPR) repeat protein
MHPIVTLSPSAHILALFLLLFPLVASAQNTNPGGAPPSNQERRDNVNYPQSRRSLTCREMQEQLAEFEAIVLKEAPASTRRNVEKARQYIVFAEYARHFCFDQSDHEEVVQAAIPHLQRALKEDPENVYVHFLMGVVKFEAHQVDSARYFFNFCYARKRDWDAKFHYYYARVLHQADEYAEALRHYNWCRAKSMPYANLDIDLKRRVAQCEFGLQLRANPTTTQVTNLGNGVNTQYGEYASAVSGDNRVLYFTMRGPGPTCQDGRQRAKKKKNPYRDFISLYLEQIYRAERSSATAAWGCPQQMPKPVNMPMYDNAPCLVSYTGDTLYIYQRKVYRARSGRDRGIIYSTFNQQGRNAPPAPEPNRRNLAPGQWSRPQEFRFVNSPEQEEHIAISPDGSFVVFASDMAGGFGGYDLYIATANGDGTFGNVTNLGRTVNSSADERAPFIHWDNETLYFSSDGHNSIGGFDVFRTKREGGRWAQPQNMGVPINSAEDDVYFHRLPDGQNGYLTSSRAGGMGYLDIYAFIGEEQNLDYDDRPFEELATVTEPNQNATTFNPNNLVKLDTLGHNPILPDTPPSTFAEIRDEVDVIGNVYFDFDKSNLTQQYITEMLNNTIPAILRNPGRKVVLLGHTDPFGNHDYNLRLSKARVEAVRQFLVDNGVPADRIETFHHGEERLVLQGSDDVNANRINRRVEVFLH